jgi:hypothetical protein
MFVNDFGMPFFSGFAFFFILIGILIFFGLRIAVKNNWNFLRLGLWSLHLCYWVTLPYFTTLIPFQRRPCGGYV